MVFHRDAPENEKLVLKRSVLGLGRDRDRQRQGQTDRQTDRDVL